MSGKEGQSTSKYSWIVTVCFFLLIAGFSILAVLMPDEELSKDERRHYATNPKLTWDAVVSGEYMTDLEDYLLDQFVGRDWLRTLKTEVETLMFGKSDANGYVLHEGGLYQLDTDWKEANVTRAAKEFAKMQEEWFADADVYYALIPDKSYFLPAEDYPIAGDEWVIAEMDERLPEATYIDLYPYLEIADYYQTDLHWKQEAVLDVADVLLVGMVSENADANDGEETDYKVEAITDAFFGGYAGASAFDVEPDVLNAVMSDTIEQTVVYDYEKKQDVAVYAPEKIDGMDPYDYYLWGARALLTMKNPNCQNGEKLLLFRDSFGSSMAPLLLEGYEEITLVDLRYISADYLPEMIDLSDYDDVLLLYSQRVLRHSDSMKF